MIDGILGGPIDQQYLLEARQMQALSLAVHIPLVCFGIAFPAMVLFLEAMWLRTGDPLYKALAKRWSHAMAILFAIGVVTGTILSFELGLLWPEFMATFGDVFGLGFALEGFSFFTEAIFIAIYIYGWDRLPPRVHFLAGFPILIAGITGAFFVIAVNGWMNDPTGFRIENGEVVDVKPVEALFNANMWHEFVHMYLAGIIVAGFLVAAVYAAGWLRGNRERRHRVALIVALSFASLAAPVQLFVGDFAARTVAEHQPLKLAILEGLPETESGAPLHIFGIYEDGEVKGGIEFPKLLSLLAYHDPNATVEGMDAAPPERPAHQHGHQHRAGSRSRRWSSSGAALPRSPSGSSGSPGGAVACPGRAGSCAPWSWPGRSRWWRSSAAGSPPRWGASPGSSTRSCAPSRR